MQGTHELLVQILLSLQLAKVWQFPTTQAPLTQMWLAP